MDDLMNVNLPFPSPKFSVETSNMSMEQGISGAGSVNVVTKAGTDQVHGDAFWFVRNTSLNASNFFSRVQDQLTRDQIGFDLGPAAEGQAVRVRWIPAALDPHRVRSDARPDSDARGVAG